MAESTTHRNGTIGKKETQLPCMEGIAVLSNCSLGRSLGRRMVADTSAISVICCGVKLLLFWRTKVGSTGVWVKQRL